MLTLELTLFRDMKPRSRPSTIQVPEQPGDRGTARLFPGATATTEHMTAIVVYVGRVFPLWALVRAQFLIDGMTFSDPRPGMVYLGPSAEPSGLIHFLPMAPPENPLFGGVHTLALRTVGIQ